MSQRSYSQGAASGDETRAAIKDELSQSSISGEIKPQKACVNCRRSKVKCVHDGGPPCKRCQDSKQECKFRLRADDETWRERTDETLSKLANAVETLISRDSGSGSQVPSHRPPTASRMMSAPGLYMNSQPYSPGTVPSSHRSSHPGYGQYPLRSPRSETIAPDYRSPSNHEGNSGSMDMPSPSVERRAVGRKRELPAEWDSEAYNNGRSPSSTSTPSQYHQRPRTNSASLMPPPLPPPNLHQDQILPSPILSHVAVNKSAIYISGYATGTRWTMGFPTSYKDATNTIGTADPRLNAMKMNFITLERARSLFVFFADKLQAHSFGYPTYPANEQMTPVIISAIVTVSALHDSWSRQYYGSLYTYLLALIQPEQDICLSEALNPELGIGVEEITGACIASAWLSGETGWRIARVAKYWAIGYLRHWEIPSRSITFGECLNILPPFRQIDLVDKLRIFLAAYIAEAQHAFILDRPSLVPDQNPSAYVVALRTAFSDSSPSSDNNERGSMTGGSGGSQKTPPSPDRQLIGHASMLYILLGAQRVQREARWAAEEATARETSSNSSSQGYSPHNGGHNGMISMSAVRSCVDRLLGYWNTWMSDTEKWKADMSSLEDISSSTASAMDLTLTYHLTKAHLGSLAVEPEFHASATVSKEASRDPRLLQAQSAIINTAKGSALAAMYLAVNQVGFRDRLVYLPGYYHFLLGHSAGFLLLLVQRKYRYLLAGEAKGILEAVETFCNVYVADIASHNFHQSASTSPHPALATAEALSRSCQHLRAQAKGK